MESDATNNEESELLLDPYVEQYGDLEYDGNDDILPTRFQKLLPLLPSQTANRIRDWITGYTIQQIDQQGDHILGGGNYDARRLGGELSPPVNPTHGNGEGEEQPEPIDLWEEAQESIEAIARMFERLQKANMSEEAAMIVIDAQLQAMRMDGRVQSGYIQIPTAGVRVGCVNDADAMRQHVGDDLQPMVGWPRKHI